MKKIIAPLFTVLMVVSCQAQESHLDAFYQKFDAGNSGTTKGSINLALLMNPGASDSGDSWMKKITMCRFLTIDSLQMTKSGEEWAELTQSIKDDHFEEWMSVRKGKSKFRVLVKERKDGQEDVVCLAVSTDGGGVLFHLRGRFTEADKDHIRSMMQDRES